MFCVLYWHVFVSCMLCCLFFDRFLGSVHCLKLFGFGSWARLVGSEGIGQRLVEFDWGSRFRGDPFCFWSTSATPTKIGWTKERGKSLPFSLLSRKRKRGSSPFCAEAMLLVRVYETRC